MNRRNFFRRAALLAAATVAAPLMVPPGPKLLVHRPPICPFYYHKGLRTFLINPEWQNAKYEIAFLFDGGHCGAPKFRDPWPPRFHTAEDARFYLGRFSKIV